MTHEDWQDLGPDLIEDGAPPPTLPIIPTDPADPRLRELPVNAEDMMVSGDQLTHMRAGCRGPAEMRVAGVPPQPCTETYLVSGQVFAFEGERLMALTVSWTSDIGYDELVAWAMKEGGSCQGISRWRTCDHWGKVSARVPGYTGVLFAPEAEAMRLIGGEEGFCPGCEGAHVLAARESHKPRRGRNPNRPYFVVHHCIAVPSDATGCPPQLRGPLVRSLRGLEQRSARYAIHGG